MWDIQADEPLLYISEIDEYFHREAVTQLLWVPILSTYELVPIYNIVSVATDGKILFWRETDKLKFPIRGYLLQLKAQTKLDLLSSTSLEFCKDTQSLIAGSISGALCKIPGASLVSPDISKKGAMADTLKWTSEAAAIRDYLNEESKRELIPRIERYCKEERLNEVDFTCIYKAKVDQRILYPSPGLITYEPHAGSVNCIKSSPHQRNLFATASADGSIRLYDQQQKGYIFQIEPGVSIDVTAVDWSPLRPSAFIVSCSNGDLTIYDFYCNKATPIIRIGSIGKISATTVRFNSRLTGYMAAGYENGVTKIYKLNRYYSVGTVKPEEYNVWKKIIEQEDKL